MRLIWLMLTVILGVVLGLIGTGHPACQPTT